MSFFSNAQSIDISPFQINTNQYRIDSVLNSVKIADKQYTIILLRDKFTEQMFPFLSIAKNDNEYLQDQAPITLLIADKVDGKIVYQKRFGTELNDYPFQNWQLTKGQGRNVNQSGKLFFSIDRGYGGSGSKSNTYFIDLSPTGIKVLNVFSAIGELSDFMLTKNDEDLILISGIWNTHENELHFSSHRYQIQKFNFHNGQEQKSNLGITKLKYPSLDEENSCETLIQKIRVKEKSFSKMFPED
jgi:hypothetical protein